MDMELKMEKDLSNCRLCLASSDNLINVYQEESSNRTLASILNQHFWFEIKENDSNNNICCGCWLKVENFHSFYTYVYDTHHNFTELVGIGIGESSANQNEIEKFQQTDDSFEKNFKDNVETNFEKAIESKVIEKQISQPNRGQVRKKKDNLEEVERENQQIREYFKMECDICAIDFDKFQNLQTHFRKEHSLRGYLKCCNRKYTKRSLLVEHIQRHIDPNAFKCELCNKIYNDKRGLEGHIELHRSTDERQFKCNDCPKSFTKKFLLVRHSYIHKNEEKKFICDDCEKPFGTKTLLQTHKKNIHEGACIHICDICAKVFRSKLVFEQHHQSVHEKKVLPKIQCQSCGVWLKDKYYLKQHMDRHDETKVFCNICGNQYLNRKTLRNHIRSVHTDKVYECCMCQKTFKKSISLKEHMAMHTGEVLYTCPYCTKSFNSSGNMYSHKKKHHPKEWEKQEKLKATGAI